MKIRQFTSRSKQSGGALLLCLLIVLVIGMSLGSYLSLVSAQNKSVMRSLAWNSAVPAMEAGVEEALMQLWRFGTTNSYYAPNGWGLMSDGWYQKSVSLGNDFGYVVRIQPVEQPIIVATGIAPSPLGARSLGATAASILTAAQDQANFVRRSVRVPTRKDRLYAKAMVAKGQIDLMGNNISSDSFDSLDSRFSTGGRYDPLKNKDNGDIATNSGVVDSLNVGEADIMGNVATGYGGSISIGDDGTVGDKLWVSSGRTGVQPGHSSSDMNIDFPSVEAPYTSGPIPPAQTIDGVDYDYVLSSGSWYLSDLSGKVLVTGDAQLYVRDQISLSGNDFVEIAPTGSLELFMGGTRASIGGNGIINETGSALSFKYWGLESNNRIDMQGNGEFVGVIYAPEAEFNLGGGGASYMDFVGASITGSVKMNGSYRFHYDEALDRVGPIRGYVPVSWNEINVAEALPSAAFPTIDPSGDSDAGDPVAY